MVPGHLWEGPEVREISAHCMNGTIIWGGWARGNPQGEGAGDVGGCNFLENGVFPRRCPKKQGPGPKCFKNLYQLLSTRKLAFPPYQRPLVL